jgi:hypothetical protein
VIAERAFPEGHPKSDDYDPNSEAAKKWREENVHEKGERDFPVGHPKAGDTPGHSVIWEAGVDPFHPEREAFTGRVPVAEQEKKAEG